MQIAAIMFLSFAVAIAWAFIIAKKGKLSVKFLLYVFLASFFAVFVSILMQGIIDLAARNFFNGGVYPYGIVFDSFIHSALPEEAVKALFFSIFVKFFFKDWVVSKDKGKPYQNPSHIKKLMFISVFYGLIFASFENLAYAIRYPESLLVRAFTSNILHAALPIYYVEISMVRNTRRVIPPLIFTWIIHGLYNMFFLIGSYFVVFGVTFVLFVIFTSINRYKKLKTN